MAGDIFEEYPSESVAEFAGASGNLWPQVSLVIRASPLTGGAERLAWVSGQQSVDAPSPWPGVKCAQVGPDWRGREISGSLGGNEAVSWILLPFNKASGVERRLCEHKAHVEATAAGA